MVDKVSPGRSVPGHVVALGARGPGYFIANAAAAAACWALLKVVVDLLLGPHDWSATLPGLVLFPGLLLVGLRRGVRLRPTDLVPYNGTGDRPAIRWDEIDAVRLDKTRSRGPVTYYIPVITVVSGEDIPLTQLAAPSTKRRLPRSRPARHVATIAAYLESYRLLHPPD